MFKSITGEEKYQEKLELMNELVSVHKSFSSCKCTETKYFQVQVIVFSGYSNLLEQIINTPKGLATCFMSED